MHGLMHRRRRNLPGMFEGRRSRFYDVVARRALRRMYRRLAADLDALAPSGADLLDVGTGPGILLAEVGERRPDLRLTGLDLSADMVALAGRNLRRLGNRVRLHTGDVTALPFPDDSFDLVVSSLSMHHWDRPAAAVPELARVLRPGGRLHVYDFRLAPFDDLTAAASAAPRFAGQPAQWVPVRTGVPFLPRFVRLTLPAVAA
jgi:ubiquinone/menaquinone biosynthesis C-methylase UbiE